MHEPGTKRHPMIDMEEFERRLRQSSGNQTEDDPLAELTRLISGQRDLVQRVAEPQGQEFDRSAAGGDVARGPRERGPGARCASKLRRRQEGLPSLRDRAHTQGHRDEQGASPRLRHGIRTKPSLRYCSKICYVQLRRITFAERSQPSPFTHFYGFSCVAGALHDGNLKDAMRVRQLNLPSVCTYSVVYQNVQSSSGSTLMLL